MANAKNSVFFDDAASRPTLTKAIQEDRIRRLATNIFTSDMSTPPQEIIWDNRWRIIAYFFPKALIVDRTAAELDTSHLPAKDHLQDNVIFLAAKTTRKKLAVPGLTIVIRSGEVNSEPPADLTWVNGLFLLSPARTIVDNMSVTHSRTMRPRTLSLAELENWLAHKTATWGEARIERLRQEALALCTSSGETKKAAQVSSLFAQLQGAEEPRKDADPYFVSTISGTSWDERRLAMFQTIAQALKTPELLGLPKHLAARETEGCMPFYESYFSNYIEGTIFTLEQAHDIIATKKLPSERPADGHDILGTYQCAADADMRIAIADDPDEIIGNLVERHRLIMTGRPDKNPGEWKTANNQVGSYQFVAPHHVEATLHKALALVPTLNSPIARALYIMLVIAEVHPFVDGNGRAARIMMNAELSAHGASRIIIINQEKLQKIKMVSPKEAAENPYFREIFRLDPLPGSDSALFQTETAPLQNQTEQNNYRSSLQKTPAFKAQQTIIREKSGTSPQEHKHADAQWRQG